MRNKENISDPSFFTSSLEITGVSKNILIDMLRKMLIIRCAEEKISENVKNGVIKCPCHLGIGQEAIGTAIALLTNKNDNSFGAHRSHTHFLALNEDTFSLFAEVLGRADGCSNGMGGSMHIIDNNFGFRGSVPIVGATIPIATGAGLASKKKNDNSIAISYFGDGACEEGVLHESLNLASILDLPVLYVCENNFFSSHLHIDMRQPSDSTSRFAIAHKIKNKIVDGNDVVLIYKILKNIISNIRVSKKPFFLEAYTYRWKGHVGHRDDIDVGVKRKSDLDLWKKRDPIKRLSDSMIKNRLISKVFLNEFKIKIQSKINKDWNRALNAPFPKNYFISLNMNYFN